MNCLDKSRYTMQAKMLLHNTALWTVLSLFWLPLSNAQGDALAKFGDVIPVLGQMARTDQDFVDGLALDLFSPSNRTLVVTNNTSPLPGNFVTGTTGEGFINLSKYSWIIKFNESAKDLIAKIELPYDPDALAKQGVQLANTYVGTLADDKKSWVVSETQRNVHMTENKTRIIKMTSLDGEYMLLGRKSEDTSNIFVQYGQGATRTVNVTGGDDKIQEAEFVDGLRLRMKSANSFTLNVDIPFGVNASEIPKGTVPLNSFTWSINSTVPSGTKLSAHMDFPINEDILAERARGHEKEGITLLVARRETKSSAAACFQPVEEQKFIKSKRVIRVKGLTTMDGQYMVLVSKKRYREMTCGKGDKESKKDKGRDGCLASASSGTAAVAASCVGRVAQPAASELETASVPSYTSIVVSDAARVRALDERPMGWSLLFGIWSLIMVFQ